MTEQQTGTIGEETAVAIPQPLHLYELAPAYRKAMELLLSIDSIEGSPDEVSGKVDGIYAMVEDLGLAIEAKVDNTAAMIAEYEASAEALVDQIRHLTARRASFTRRAEGLRAYLFQQLKSSGLTQIDGPRFTAAIRLNPEAVQVADLSAIPRKYIKVEIVETPLKNEIKAARKAGETVPGVEFTRGERLEIR
jgi:hypothetical protein